MSRLSSDRCAVELEAEAARLAEAVYDADPALPVPTCPEWRLAELTAHVGRGHRWAAAIVERRAAGAPVPVDEIEGLLQPEGASERSAWLRAGAQRLADAVREAGPETEVWTWATDRTAGFWLRRMAHDTLVHRFDAELALGRDVTVAPEVAAAGISDLLTSFADLPARFAELRGDGETLHFHATDDGLGSAGEWLVRRTAGGAVWEHGHVKADVAIRGRAVDLLLVLWRRKALSDSPVEVLGDEALFAHWLAHSAF
jgi:uncharacterized protein (TIGR03083 family)